MTDATPAAVEGAARAVVESVEDPELPHVTIGELGMVRDVRTVDRQVHVTLTPTYTGCPATEQIRDDVGSALVAAGYEPTVEFAMSPPWSTDWISAAGRAKLRAAGIAPPHEAHELAAEGSVRSPAHETRLDLPVACPRCSSRRTKRLGDFGSTACKASFVCESCREPFEHFKAL